MNLKALIKDYLQTAKLMQLATVSAGKPWVCNVWFAADEALSIYWFSSTTRRHSHEVVSDPHVAGAICLPFTPDDKPRGLQFEGTAEQLRGEADIQRAISLYSPRIFSATKVHDFMSRPDHPHCFYRIKPELFVLFDIEHFPGDPRQEYRLTSTKAKQPDS